MRRDYLSAYVNSSTPPEHETHGGGTGRWRTASDIVKCRCMQWMGRDVYCSSEAPYIPSTAAFLPRPYVQPPPVRVSVVLDREILHP